MRVLIVDDSSTMRRIIANTLKRLGYEDIVEAGDGAEGLQVLVSKGADLVLTDWNMPKMDGRTFAAIVKGEASSAEIEIVVVSSIADSAMEAELRALGVASIVKKPVSPAKMREALEGAA